MSRRTRGRRYDAEPKLNVKKVIAVIVALIVIIMFVFVIKGIVTGNKDKDQISSLSYFASFQDNKWGIIDSNGNDVITPSYAEMIIVPNEKKDVFLCTFDVNYETGEYSTKVLNKDNQEIYTDYEQVEAIQNRDDNNQLWYEENVLRIRKDGKYGIMNLDGKVLVEPQYDEIIAGPGSKKDKCLKHNIDIMIEDKANNVMEISKYIPVICFDTPYNLDIAGDNIYRVYSWYQIYKYFLDKDVE